MFIAFDTRNGNKKLVSWDTQERKNFGRHPTLAEVQETAQKEFSGIAPEMLILETGGFDGEILTLKEKTEET